MGLIDFKLPTLMERSSFCSCSRHGDFCRDRSPARREGGIIAEGEDQRWRELDRIRDVQRPLFVGPHDGESPRSSSEYQTSGFDSPRRSAETLGTDLASRM